MKRNLPLFAFLLLSYAVFGQITSKKLLGIDPNTTQRIAGDQFGFSVAATDDILVVGAPFHDFDASGADSLKDAGAVYIFYRNEGGANNWGLKKKIVAEGNNARMAGDNFGNSVAISGNTIVVGAIFQDFNASGLSEFSDAGAAYVFYKDEGGTDNWGLKEKLVGRGLNGRQAEDNFGISVGISGDVIVVGSYQHDYDATGGDFRSFSGAAYVFYRNEGGADSWGLKQKLTGSGPGGRNLGDFFGTSVAIDGNMIAIGANLQDYNHAGTGNENDAGAVYIFYKDEGGNDNWGLKKKLIASGSNGRLEQDNFGIAVALSGDVLVSGAYLQDYDANGNGFVNDAGAAYVYHKDEGGADNWGFKQKLTGGGKHGRSVSDNFGASVAIFNNIIAVGASQQDYDSLGDNLETGAGAVFIFMRNQGGTDNWGLRQRLVNSGMNNRAENDNFGNAVACAADVLLVGVFGQDYDENGANAISNAGAATIFNYTDIEPLSVIEQQKGNVVVVNSYRKNIRLQFFKEGNYVVTVYDVMGRRIYNRRAEYSNNTIENINLNGISSGYYMVNVSNGTQHQAFKVFID